MAPIRPALPFPPTGHPDRGTARAVGTGDDPPAAPRADPPSGSPAASAGSRADERLWRVAAWVAPQDVSRLSAALGPVAVVVPCDSLATLSAVVCSGAEAAVVASVSLTPRDEARLATLLTWYPTTVFAGLATPAWPPDGTAALLAVLGATAGHGRTGGTRARRPAGNPDWQRLTRSLAAACLADSVQRACVAAVLGEVWGRYRTLRGAPAEAALYHFFAAAFGPGGDTVDDAAARLGVDVASLRAWFVSHQLPGADRYVAAARLVRSAWVGEPPAPTTVAVAVWRPRAEESAPLHRAARQVRRLAALGASAPSRRSVGTLMLNRYRAALVVPFRDALRTFDPARGTAW